MNVIFTSYGNDSTALIQWAIERQLPSHVIYSDTGWCSADWADRVARMEDWVRSHGLHPHRTDSIGLPELVRQRKAWPRQGMQFCTLELKIRPALAWLDAHDPDRQATCLVGVRRAESRARAQWPERQISPNHGGRELWAPLLAYTDEDRDQLLHRAGVTPLPHRSMECYPCINSNRRDLRALTPERVDEIEKLETSLGYTSKGKPRTMFRPYRHMGAVGIREVIRWAHSEPGQFTAEDDNCDAGWCGL